MTVLRAYQLAAIKVNAKTNCVVTWIEAAEETAKRLDRLSREQRGPLHGVPISVKECFDVVNTLSSCGMAFFAHHYPKEDSVMVQIVRELGGVPFCKTNVPQGMLSLQCSNPLYGQTSNPHSKDGYPRECGGSSGGEGALIGGGGSILGLGGDIGGSLRNPVAFCGGYTLKPTFGRHLSELTKLWVGDPENVFLVPVSGYMTRSARALEQVWRMTWRLGTFGNDPNIVPMDWNEVNFQKKLTVGYFDQPGMVKPASGCIRAVKEAKKKLEDGGYKVVKFSPPDIEEIAYLFNGCMFADKSRAMYKKLNYDLTDSNMYGFVLTNTFYKLPWILRKYVVNPLMKYFTGFPGFKKVFSTTTEMRQAVQERDQFVRNYLDQMDAAGVDVILCPGQLFPAPPTGVMGMMVAGVSPYIPWNVMNFPAGIAPVTTWQEEDDLRMKDYPQDTIIHRTITRFCDEGCQDLPLAVQVVARPHMDEQVLQILSFLDPSYRDELSSEEEVDSN